MQVHDEIAHLRVVHGALRLRLPGRVGARVVRVEPDDVDLVDVLEPDVIDIRQLTAENEMQQLLRRRRHGLSPEWYGCVPARLVSRLRHSYRLAARLFTKVGTEGHW